MLIEKFIKKVFVSFYKDENYKFLCEIKKQNKTIKEIKKEFENKNELINEINEIKEDYTQIFISTIITSINQGIIPSCNKHEYKKREIDIENIKIVCIKNKYSFYVALYELLAIQKEYPFDIDFIYSIFAPIDNFAKKRDNYFYVLILKERIAIVGYKNEIPIFADIIEFENNETTEDEEDLLEDIDLDIEEISEDIEEEAEIIDTQKDDLKFTSIENEIIKSLKNSIKEYYENYTNDFLEKIIFLDTISIGNNLKKLTEDELLLESEIIDFDLLKEINLLSERENV